MSVTPKQAANRVRQLDKVIDGTIARAFTAAINDGLHDARELSSGPFSLAELRKRDYPYATRHGSPLLPPAMINAQSGEFREKWRGQHTAVAAGGVFQLRNDSSVADFLNAGTPAMFRRPIADVLTVKLADHAEKRVNEAGARLNKRYA